MDHSAAPAPVVASTEETKREIAWEILFAAPPDELDPPDEKPLFFWLILSPENGGCQKNMSGFANNGEKLVILSASSCCPPSGRSVGQGWFDDLSECRSAGLKKLKELKLKGGGRLT